MQKLQIDIRHLKEIPNIHPTLLEVVEDLVREWPFDVPLRITSFNRTWEEERANGRSGIHAAGPPWRAIDIGTRDLDVDEVEKLCNYLNQRWTYDPERGTLKVYFCAEHGTGPHIHAQVHPRTRRQLVEYR